MRRLANRKGGFVHYARRLIKEDTSVHLRFPTNQPYDVLAGNQKLLFETKEAILL